MAKGIFFCIKALYRVRRLFHKKKESYWLPKTIIPLLYLQQIEQQKAILFLCIYEYLSSLYCLVHESSFVVQQRQAWLKGGSINYHRKVFLCRPFYVLSSCGLFLYKTGCASSIQTSLIAFGLLRFWFNLLARSVV